MTNMAVKNSYIPAMSDAAIGKVTRLAEEEAKKPQIPIETKHVIHGGMYARTIMIPAGVLLTGALIKLPTMLIVEGNIIVYIGDESREISGYNVFPASANRKQAFVAKTDTYLTMIFATEAKSIEEAEKEFTDEAALLISRKEESDNEIVITGE